MVKVVQKCVQKHPSADAVVAKLIDSPSFTLPVAKCIKYEVEKNALDRANMQKRFMNLKEAVQEKNKKAEDGIRTRNTDPARSPSPLTAYPTTRKGTNSHTILQLLRVSRSFEVIRSIASKVRIVATVLAATTTPQHHWCTSEAAPNPDSKFRYY